MFVLDTNVISELRKARLGKADANVVAWTGTVDAAELYVSAISLMELELGVLSLERKDPAQGGVLRTWLEQQVLRSSQQPEGLLESRQERKTYPHFDVL